MKVYGRSGRPAAAAAALLAAVAASGCGAGHAPAPTIPPAPPTGATTLHPAVGGRELARLTRVGAVLGASDLVTYGSDGSAVVVQSYGGGGTRVRRCRLRRGELHRLRAALARLPLGPAHRTRVRRRTTFYTAPPAQYTLSSGGRVQTFTQDAMPVDARPLVALLERTLSGRAAACRTRSATRPS